MVSYESDEAIQEIQDEMYREEESRPQGAWTKLKPQTRMIISIGLGILLILVVLKKISLFDGILYAAIALIIIWMMNTGDSKRTELTWLECMIRVHDLLYFLQKHPIGNFQQIPKGIIKVYPIGRKQWYEGKAFKRSYKVDLYDQEEQITEMYFVEVDVFTGDIITFKSSPEGVYGDETKDIKLMPGADLVTLRKRDQFLGRKSS